MSQPADANGATTTAQTVSPTGGKQIIYYNDGFCGSGKTHWMINKIVSEIGHYLVAVDRIEVIAERTDAILAIQKNATRFAPIDIEAVHTKDGYSDTSVSSRVQGKIIELNNASHTVLFITHESLKRADFNGANVSDWIVLIDEVPAITKQDKHRVSYSVEFLKANYRLTPSADHPGLNEIEFAPDHISSADVQKDDAHKIFLNLHNEIQAGNLVLTNASDWDETRKSAKAWHWVGLWSPIRLRGFREVYVLGNSFEDTITHELIKANYSREIDLFKFPIPGSRVWAPRDIKIEYFTDDHTAGSYFFNDTDEGQTIVKAIGCHLAKNKDEHHIWSGNKKVMPVLKRQGIKGTMISPKQAGTNSYEHIHNASFIYTAKASDEETTILKCLSIPTDLIVRDREYETIIQFLLRTSLRVPNSTEPVSLTLYDRQQADFVKAYLDQHYGFNCVLDCLNENNAFTRRSKGRVGADDEPLLTKKEQDARRKKKARDDAKADELAAGIVRKRPGRPRKPVPDAILSTPEPTTISFHANSNSVASFLSFYTQPNWAA